MDAHPHHVPLIAGEPLDFYLSLGYYRMQQDLFTCRFLQLDGEFHTVHWLRLVLPQVEYGPAQQQLLRRNARFSTVLKPFVLTDELETLYAAYRRSITFDAPASVESFLLDGATRNDFDTYVLEVRDGAQLIAAGIFDEGHRSLAGIMNFYDPAYRKHSLGKHLMLLKINHARSRRMAYYYPGYLVHNYPKFDYKLYPCPAATQVFDALSGQWVPFSWEAVAAQSAALLAAE